MPQPVKFKTGGWNKTSHSIEFVCLIYSFTSKLLFCLKIFILWKKFQFTLMSSWKTRSYKVITIWEVKLHYIILETLPSLSNTVSGQQTPSKKYNTETHKLVHSREQHLSININLLRWGFSLVKSQTQICTLIAPHYLFNSI